MTTSQVRPRNLALKGRNLNSPALQRRVGSPPEPNRPEGAVLFSKNGTGNGDRQGCHLPHPPPLLRDPPPSGRLRYPYSAGVVGPQECPDDDDLHPRSELGRAGRAEPGRPSIGWLTRQPMSYKNDSTEPSVPPRSCFSAVYGRSRASLREVHIAMDLSCNTTPNQFHPCKAFCRISTSR
jgi:hypothetical protein